MLVLRYWLLVLVNEDVMFVTDEATGNKLVKISNRALQSRSFKIKTWHCKRVPVSQLQSGTPDNRARGGGLDFQKGTYDHEINWKKRYTLYILPPPSPPGLKAGGLSTLPPLPPPPPASLITIVWIPEHAYQHLMTKVLHIQCVYLYKTLLMPIYNIIAHQMTLWSHDRSVAPRQRSVNSPTTLLMLMFVLMLMLWGLLYLPTYVCWPGGSGKGHTVSLYVYVHPWSMWHF